MVYSNSLVMHVSNNRDFVHCAVVGDPNPDLQDPHVFGPSGSVSISQRYGSGSILPFFSKVVERTEKMLAK